MPGVWFLEHILFFNPRELTSASSVTQKFIINLFKTPIMGTMFFKNGKKQHKTKKPQTHNKNSCNIHIVHPLSIRKEDCHFSFREICQNIYVCIIFTFWKAREIFKFNCKFKHFICVCVYVCIHIHICMYIHMYMYTYIYIYLRTKTLKIAATLIFKYYNVIVDCSYNVDLF